MLKGRRISRRSLEGLGGALASATFLGSRRELGLSRFSEVARVRFVLEVAPHLGVGTHGSRVSRVLVLEFSREEGGYAFACARGNRDFGARFEMATTAAVLGWRLRLGFSSIFELGRGRVKV
jgi:hypothetical protein